MCVKRTSTPLMFIQRTVNGKDMCTTLTTSWGNFSFSGTVQLPDIIIEQSSEKLKF